MIIPDLNTPVVAAVIELHDQLTELEERAGEWPARTQAATSAEAAGSSRAPPGTPRRRPPRRPKQRYGRTPLRRSRRRTWPSWKPPVKRVDEENGQLRGAMARLEAVVRAFAWTTNRWSRQMHRVGIEPEPPHPLVEALH
ncbi:hypothetical protein [Streptomyces sp. NPDC052015]|uniref:hypothetical protein n=1 Tax=Streptomyces sp. NPDC052015 TaxID=3154755 RepID=UPI003423FC58